MIEGKRRGGAVEVAILGSGNIGTDLLLKLLRYSKLLRPTVMAGIDPTSDGLARAANHGVKVTAGGIDGLQSMEEFKSVELVFDATSASAHPRHAELLQAAGKQVIDLTPAALGPFVVPVVNLGEHADAPNVNLVSCGGQATIPIVSAIASVSEVYYAEIVASISSRSAGPGTRANIDEFTATTARGLEIVGKAQKAKAIIILNPAEPPLTMRDTVLTISAGKNHRAIEAAIKEKVEQVQTYVPGFRLKQEIQFDHFDDEHPIEIPGYGTYSGTKTSVFLEIEGRGDYLPTYSGNLDIMTASAMATAERIARSRFLRAQQH
ncbi:acetaldehyde dehydrogenase (acetylating) [Lentisalinibacter orientalis]|uniref:acetaldehyde dehydrogenase (acetylating) n=1 Tax=Lentisalinibacter orientalis TaxID=2992241 RepID=UPI003868681C